MRKPKQSTLAVQPLPEVPPNPLNDVATEDLMAELERRRRDRQRVELKRRHEANEAVAQNIEFLLTYVPSHQFAGCSDDKPRGRYHDNDYECTRCSLLRLRSGESLDDDYMLVIGFAKDPLPNPDGYSS